MKIKRIVCSLMLLVIFLGQLAPSTALAETIIPTVAGDDPGVTITATNPITSEKNVEIDVTIAASAGKITEDGEVKVTIPKDIVKNKNDLINNLVIDDPFYLADPALIEDGEGNYVLNIAYDHTKYDPNNAQGNTVKVLFKAPYMNGNDSNVNYPDSVDFKADMTMGSEIISSDKTTSEVIHSVPGNPLLSKFGITSAGRDDIYGQEASILSKEDPSSNVFAIIVNYNQKNISNAQLVDTIPEGTELYDPNTYIPATGDSTIIDHFRIAKVTGRDATGIVNSWEYVTTDFADKIHLTSTGFSIDFGDLTSEDSYVVMYAQKVVGDPTPDEFGARYNQAVLMGDGDEIITSGAYMGLKEVMYDSVTLNKQVSQPVLASNSGDLVYTLTFANKKGATAVGTKLVDPLPSYVTYVETTDNSSGYLTDAAYDSETNTLSYDFLKELPEGETVTVAFKAHYENDSAQSDQKIENKAYFNYSGTNIYSNIATTLLDGSAELMKLDSKTGAPLEGAIFKIVDESGQTVEENLVSDSEGKVYSGLLKPGKYAFIETQAPKGYALDATPNSFFVESNQSTKVNLTMYNSESIDIAGTKTWVDNDDSQKLRPDTITVNLYQNNIKINSVTIGENEGWKYSFDSLPKYSNDGEEYSYRVEEEKVENYKTEQDGYNFTNVLEDSTDPGTPTDPEIPIDSGAPKKPGTPDSEENDISYSGSKYLPTTGEKAAFGLSFAGLSALVLTSYYYFRNKK